MLAWSSLRAHKPAHEGQRAAPPVGVGGSSVGRGFDAPCGLKHYFLPVTR